MYLDRFMLLVSSVPPDQEMRLMENKREEENFLKLRGTFLEIEGKISSYSFFVA